MTLDPLSAISPLDGRYFEQTRELSAYFSEEAFIKHRILVEIEWFIYLLKELKLGGKKGEDLNFEDDLRSIYKNFDALSAKRVKEIEKVTNHDVKAVEYFIRENIKDLSCEKFSEFLHFGCTSEDINNLAISLMVKGAVEEVILPVLTSLLIKLDEMGKKYSNLPMLSLTHGQSATPTTCGKELINFASRLNRQLLSLSKQEYLGKFNGATGNFCAHVVAYPKIDWQKNSEKFVESLGLKHTSYSTQIECHDFLAEIFHNLIRVGNIILSIDRDFWLYISRGIFKQRLKEGEVGSSTMPHKVNPIDFENSEGNIGLATAIFEHLSVKLPVARLQRDLSDSTAERSIGSGFAYLLIALRSLLKGLAKVEINKEKLEAELEENWEVLAEAVQTLLRKNLQKNGYEKLKELSRGKKWGKGDYLKLVKSLNLPKTDEAMLLKLSPSNYIGLSAKLAKEFRVEM